MDLVLPDSACFYYIGAGVTGPYGLCIMRI
jgi:hypothetical protein